MNRRFAFTGGRTIVGALVLLVALIGLGAQGASAQNRPELPTLSLTGTGSGWNQAYYPDGRVWVARRGNNGERTVIIPVFIKNCWRDTEVFEAFPIYSFKFKVQFDSTALEFMSVEKNGPLRDPQNLPIGSLADDFEYSTDVAFDTTYQSVINAPIQNRLRGKRVMVTGISSKSLPQTGDFNAPCDQRPYVELCYLRFRVIANPAGNPVSARTPLILTNDTLFYNDFQVGFERAFPDDPIPSEFAGLGGVDNFFTQSDGTEGIRDPLRPSKPGMLWVEVTDLIPHLSFTHVADPRFRTVDSVSGTNRTSWFVVNPITIDSGSNFDDNVNGIGTLDIDVINAVTGTRASDIVVQSDAEWLKFKSFLKGGQGETNPFPSPVREGYIRILDKGILGTTSGITPNGDNTTARRDLNMRIICDPNELPLGEGGEVAGTYEGNITFKSKTIEADPVRIKVTFIYFRNPFEPSVFDENDNWQAGPSGPTTGIRLAVRNSAVPPERTFLIMGVGARATDEVDLLFGEAEWQTPLIGFGARWYPRDKEGTDLYEYGLRDLWAATPTRPKAASRDIRDIYSDTTLIYWCRFQAGFENAYPIVISWDTDDFSPASDLFIRDTLDGSRFNVNMRNATSLGGTRYSTTITDADIDAFVIEYTLPKVARFPVINKGWNLLSMPVRPASTYWKDVFKNALNVPIRFSQNLYQSEIDLRVGVGYFIKYSDEIDVTIAGARVTRIDDQNNSVRLYEGWNTIGSLSTPVGIDAVGLLPFGSGAFPVRDGDIYGYVTDRGYQAVSEIVPGLGYWMKITGQAWLQMVATSRPKTGVNFSSVRASMMATSTPVTILDADGKTSTIYVAEQGAVDAMGVFELPPLPPNGLFDVRFSNQAYVEDVTSPLVRFQGVSFPMTVTINNPERNYSVVNPVNGQVLGTAFAHRMNVITITDPNTPSLRLMGEENDLGALSVSVTPNPVATTGLANITVPSAGRVIVELYNVVGERVATIMDEVKAAGIYGVDVNTALLPAGRYIVKVSNGNAVVISSMSVVR